jgi:hypothetical protein
VRETFAIWTGDWVASLHDDLVLMPMAENEVYQKAFATLNAKYFKPTAAKAGRTGAKSKRSDGQRAGRSRCCSTAGRR